VAELPKSDASTRETSAITASEGRTSAAGVLAHSLLSMFLRERARCLGSRLASSAARSTIAFTAAISPRHAARSMGGMLFTTSPDSLGNETSTRAVRIMLASVIAASAWRSCAWLDSAAAVPLAA